MQPQRRIYFLSNACHLCKAKKTTYVCMVCRMIFYCSPGHRREDWYNHSKICWAIYKVCQSEKIDHLCQLFCKIDCTSLKHVIVKKCIEFLGRGLQCWELEMIYHPRMCEVCHDYDWEKLKPCEKCDFIFTCPKYHFRKDHSKWCDTLKLYSESVRNEHLRSTNKNFNLERPLKVLKTNFTSMREFLDINFEKKSHKQSSLYNEIEKAWISELLTYPLTVLNSLHIVKASKEKEITVLFIGAEKQAEVEPLEKWEEYLLHQFPEVQNLNLIFLGPELQIPENCHLSQILCKACRRQNKAIRCEFIPGKFFHEYSPGENIKINLICAMNSGMYRPLGFRDEDSWSQTVTKLFVQGTSPVLVTEYTEQELKKDLERLQTLCVKTEFLQPYGINPFSSLKPNLNIMIDDDCPVIFKNYFSFIALPSNMMKS